MAAGTNAVLAVDRRAVNTHAHWPGVRERVIAVEETSVEPVAVVRLEYPTLEPVLTPAEIAEVEAQFGVALPDEYRTFLADVGAGGPGPAFELTSLRRIDGQWGWVWENNKDHPLALDPSGPFVETEDWAAQQMATLRAARYEPATHLVEQRLLGRLPQALRRRRRRCLVPGTRRGCDPHQRQRMRDDPAGSSLSARTAGTPRPELRGQPALRADRRRKRKPSHLAANWCLESGLSNARGQLDDQGLVTLARPTHSDLLNPSLQRDCTQIRMHSRLLAVSSSVQVPEDNPYLPSLRHRLRPPAQPLGNVRPGSRSVPTHRPLVRRHPLEQQQRPHRRLRHRARHRRRQRRPPR